REVAEVGHHDRQFSVDGAHFDYLGSASDVVGTRAIFERSPELAAAAPTTAARVATLRPGQRYAVLRLWLDRDVTRELTGFVITDRERILDAVAFLHLAERESERWVAERRAAGLGGAVLELHCYAVPEHLPEAGEAESALREQFLADLHQFFPELAAAELLDEHIYVRRDFPGF